MKVPLKHNRKRIVQNLDREVSKYVRARDGACVVCGSVDQLTNGHLFSRIAYSTRWDLLNCHAQCWGCNYSHEYDFYPFQRWFISKFGQEGFDELYSRFKTPRKFSNPELAALLEEMKLLNSNLNLYG